MYISDSVISRGPYIPIYEAITNSIQAIKECKREDGKINIKLIRDTTVYGKCSCQT